MTSNNIEWLENQLKTVTNEREKIDLLNQLAQAVRPHNLQRSVVLSERACELAQTGRFAGQPYRRGLAQSLYHLGCLNAGQGHNDLALSRWFEALELYREMADLQSQSDVVQQIEQLYRQAVGQAKQQHQIADSLREVATILNSSLDLEVVLVKIMEQLGRVVDYDSAAIFLHQDDNLVISNGANLHKVKIGYQVTLTSQDPAARVFKERRSLIIGDVYTETGWQRWQEGDRIRSWVGTPLLADRHIIGVLTVDHADIDAYQETDAEILQIFADQAAVAIRNAWQVQRTEEALHGAGLLYRLGSILAKTSHIRDALEKVLVEYLWALKLPEGGISLFDTERYGQEVQVFYRQGSTQPSPTLDAASLMYQQIIETGRPLVIEDVLADSRLAASRHELAAYNIRSMLIAPLIVRGEVIGLLRAAATDRPHHFSERDRDLAQAVADQIATAIENARLFTREHQQRQLAENQNKELDAFARTVAHDIKNPLGTIVTYADFLAHQYSNLETESAIELIKIIQQAAHKGANIIDELLLLAGIRKQEVTCEPLDMEPIVLLAKDRLNFMIKEYEANIDLPRQWPSALGYAPWVEEVWVNYISNGLKYGGRPPRLILGATPQSNGSIRFWIQDNGRGVTPAAQSTLFTEFTRLNEVRAQGYGLGLSIVRRIIEKLGGQVGVESQGIPGQGSLFYFTLPGSPEPS